MEFTERVFILQTGRFREADLWVRCLSSGRGVFTAFAFGGSRSRRRFSGCLDTFSEVSVRVKATRGAAPGEEYLALQEGVLLRGLQRLRSDWTRFGMAVNCAKFLQAFGISPEGAEKAHFLFARTLRLLEEADTLPHLLPLLFRVRLVFDQGYALDVRRCARCTRELRDGAYLFVHEGRLVCEDCGGRLSGQAFYLGAEAVGVLSSVCSLPPDGWGACERSAAKQCGRAMDAFIRFHVGLAWENGRFVRV